MPSHAHGTLVDSIQQIKTIQPNPARVPLLDQLADGIRTSQLERPDAPVRITFICTHNSRRSQLAQAWLAALADWYDLAPIQTFSGGTEVTSFHPNAVASLDRAGFHIQSGDPDMPNPRYETRFNPEADPLRMYSKRFDDPTNPHQDFIAVMVCTDAEKACPYVPGARFRLALPYLDPKRSDGTPEAPQVYDQCSIEIASEMNYVLQKVFHHE